MTVYAQVLRNDFQNSQDLSERIVPIRKNAGQYFPYKSSEACQFLYLPGFDRAVFIFEGRFVSFGVWAGWILRVYYR